jgi:hypothetical protein
MKHKRKKKKKQRKYLPNDWAFFSKLKPDRFKRVSFKDFWEDRVLYWELIPGIQLVARAEHLSSGAVQEHTFTSSREVSAFFRQVERTGEPYHVHCFDSTHCFTAAFNTDD